MITPAVIGFCGLIVLVILLFLGFPIGFTMAIVGTVGLLFVTDPEATFWVMHSVIFHESFHWVYVVLPMFFLLGHFAHHGDIGRDAYDTINKWVGHVKGGLLLATISACAGMGFASGSSLATAATFTKLSLPEMRRYGYNVGLSCGAIACSGTLAALIPPSGMMVIFCVLTDCSLGKLMIAGIFPGLLTAACFIGVLRLYLVVKPELAPLIPQKISLKEKIIALKWTGPLLVIIASILGGIYLGVFTPTEAGATGGLVTFLFMVLRKGLKFSVIYESLVDTVRLTSMIFIIIIGAMFFNRFLAVSGVIDLISKFMLGLAVPKHVILVIILII